MSNWNSSNFLIAIFWEQVADTGAQFYLKKSNSSFCLVFWTDSFFSVRFFFQKMRCCFFLDSLSAIFFVALNYFFDINLCSFQVAFDFFPISLYECLFKLIFQVINCIKRVSVNRWTKLYKLFKIKMPCEQFLKCHVFLILFEGVEKMEKSFILIVFQSNTFFIE